MGIRKNLKKHALAFSQKALERLMSDEKRALAIANAVGSAQRGKKKLDERQEDLMRALNLATKGDFKGVGKQLAGLKRRSRELDERLDELASRRAQGH